MLPDTPSSHESHASSRIESCKEGTSAMSTGRAPNVVLHIPVYPGFAIELDNVANASVTPTRMGAKAGPKTFACLGSSPTPNAVKIST